MLPTERGVEVRFEAHGAAIVVRRCSSGRDYIASPDPHPPVQAWGPTGDRFGTADDIRSDIEHFLTIGALPRWSGCPS